MPVGADSTSGSQINNHAAFIWSVADLLRGDYKQSEYGRVILPLTVLRRLDCVLEPVKAEMLAKYEQVKGRVENFGPVLDALTDIDGLWNTSRFDLPKLLDDPDNLADNLRAYIHGFSPEAHARSSTSSTSPPRSPGSTRPSSSTWSCRKFAEIDLHPDRVSNLEMGYLYEELIRRFSELSNETAGEHFTPREVIRLMVEPAVRRRRRPAPQARHRQDPVRPGVRHRRHAVGGRGPRSASSTPTPASRCSARSSTPRPTPSAAPT